MFLKFLLIFVPISIGLAWFGADPLLIFALSCLAIVPLADLLAKATERLAAALGPTVGGLVSATMGNAPELIVCGFALQKGLVPVVKSAIVGTVLMNLLLLPGIAMVVGGMRRERQTFNKITAGMSAALLSLASVGLVVPTLFQMSSKSAEVELSLEIASILFGLYLLSLVFTLKTHRHLFVRPAGHEEAHASQGSLGLMLGQLILIAIVLAVVSENMTSSLDPAVEALHLSEAFAGVIILASLGNVAQLISAVRFAKADNMDLAMSTTIGAATQVALAVAPILMFVGLLLGQPMDLLFSTFQVVTLTFAVFLAGQFTRDGESNWMEGAMLVALYLIFALGFYFGAA